MTEMFEGLCPECKAVMVEWQKMVAAESLKHCVDMFEQMKKDKPPVL